ncbi:MAG: class I SAM-dependent methyltransferase [Candidatus Levybacteria bacterium]|nr:class I SAM-dependent methyltransferase [Candidatus Levybacteria bacterium]
MNKSSLKDILDQVPPDYYQKGIKRSLLQRIWHKKKLKAVLKLVENDPNKILDIGCASGWFLWETSKRFPKAKCTGVDIYKKAIDYGSKQYKSIKFICADAHHLSFQDDSFDLIICTEVLEHVIDPKGVLKEIKRLLSPHGVAIIEMDTGSLLFRLIWHFWVNSKFSVWKGAHLHTFSTKKLEKMIEDYGFLITKKKIFNFGMAVAFQSKKDEV